LFIDPSNRAPFDPARDSISDSIATCGASRAAPFLISQSPILSRTFDA